MTVAVFLLVYLVALLIVVVFSAFVYYHLFRFGFKSRIVYFVNGLYAVIVCAIIAISLIYIVQIDWTTPLLSSLTITLPATPPGF